MTKTPVNVRMSLRIWGDLIEPDQISIALGTAPTSSHRKGDIRVGKKTGKSFNEHTGLWRLESLLPKSATFQHHVSTFLSRVASDLSIWDQLNEQHNLDLFCGIFILKDNINQVFDVPKEILRMLSDRHITIVFDCYATKSRMNENPELD